MSENQAANTGLDEVMQKMTHNPGFKAKPKLPEPDVPTDLTPEQEKILQELPKQAGFYWVEDIRTNERNVAFIDYARIEGIVEHWGHKMDATPGGIGVIERWLMGWTILGPVTPYVEPITYETNANYGMF